MFFLCNVVSALIWVGSRLLPFFFFFRFEFHDGITAFFYLSREQNAFLFLFHCFGIFYKREMIFLRSIKSQKQLAIDWCFVRTWIITHSALYVSSPADLALYAWMSLTNLGVQCLVSQL